MTAVGNNALNSRSTLTAAGKTYAYYSLEKAAAHENDLLKPGGDGRLAIEGQRDVGERPDRHQDRLSRLPPVHAGSGLAAPPRTA